uniref:Tyrosine-protein kinase ephrin type A/B receptor-like domain-containing protein n=1 Tax=Entomoneis paludosa TaxID=265537 RepID=A0A7S2VAF9_9STRA|mmetsp:Transcript_11934/g.24577  ORF Transcript_11934/g.24577 Transcript_11934/m.24577 type:complete len:117 (+) Transcript_11934:135-485(+)
MSAHGDVYVLVKADDSTSSASPGSVTLRSTCKVDQCHGSEFLGNGGVCTKCPEGSVAPHGSTSIDACVPCAEFGAVAPHPKATVCVFPTVFDSSIKTGTGWRLISDSSNLAEGWKW